MFGPPLISRFHSIALTLCFAGHLAAAPPETAPAFAWAAAAGGLKNDQTRCIHGDAEGRLFLAGSFGGTAKSGDASITSTGSDDLDGAKLKAK